MLNYAKMDCVIGTQFAFARRGSLNPHHDDRYYGDPMGLNSEGDRRLRLQFIN